MDAARAILALNPGLYFCFVSGSGADGNAMWARVKKRAEDDLRTLDLGGLMVFRPAYIQDEHGAQVRGALYRTGYMIGRALSPLIRRAGGGTSNAEIGQAMLVAARDRLNVQILDSSQINEMAQRL